MTAFDHDLEHETAHLACGGAVGTVVVDEGDVGGALQQAVEVVGVDGHLVVDGGVFCFLKKSTEMIGFPSLLTC